MRKFLIPLLAASMLVPAAASAEEPRSLLDAFRAKARNEQASSSERRSSRGDHDARSEHSVAVQQHDDGHSSGGHRDAHRDARRDHREFHATDPGRREHREYHREAERQHRSDHRSWNRDSGRGTHGDYHRDIREEHGDLHAGDPSRREHRQWHSQVERQHDRRHSAWSTDWRRDSRYDWYDYRNRHDSLFRLGRYYDPYGYRYRRFSIGYNLWPSYYGSSFWLNDPWHYRLPPAYGPYRWVRYYDDALLVNIYTGQVVDVVYNVFW